MARVLCAFDLDNTLYDFIGFFGPAYRGMLHALSKRTGISFDELNASARSVIHARGSIEYPLLVREMSVFRGAPDSEVVELERLAVSSHARVRRKNLQAYDGVRQLLESLEQSGVILAAVTNASTYKAVRRLEALGIVTHFSFLVGLNNFDISDRARTIGRADPWSKYKSLTPIIITEDERKPSSVPYKRLLEASGPVLIAFAVGDNIGRDLAPASHLGYKTVWARYGTKVDADDYATVLDITPPTVKAHEIATSTYSPDFAVDSPVDIVPIVSPTLF